MEGNMSDLTVPQGDYGYNLSFTIKDNNGAPYPLTSYTITMNVWFAGSPNNSILTGVCVIDVAANGTCHYPVQSGDFNAAGDYLIELELTKAGVVESTRNYTLKVEESA